MFAAFVVPTKRECFNDPLYNKPVILRVFDMLVFVGSLNFSSLSALLIQDLKKSPAKGGNIHDLWRNWTIGLRADCNQSVLRCRCFVDFWWHSSNSWYILSFELKLVQSIPLSRLKSRKFIPKSWPNFQNHVFETTCSNHQNFSTLRWWGKTYPKTI